MKKIVCICFVVLMFCSCRNDIVIDPSLDYEYAVVIKNGTHDEIMVECKQLPIGIIELVADEKSDTFRTDSEEITIDYFGKGTYWKQKKCVVSLDKNSVTEVVLKN